MLRLFASTKTTSKLKLDQHLTVRKMDHLDIRNKKLLEIVRCKQRKHLSKINSLKYLYQNLDRIVSKK